MEQLLQFLDMVYPLSTDLRAYLVKTLQTKTLRKKEYILKAGQICRHIYFIKKGILRCYYEKENTEVCSWFMKEADVIASIESFFRQAPSYEYIQALEDCELHYISYDDLQFIYNNYPEFNFTGRVLVEKYYVLSEQRLFSMRMQRSHERYEYLMTHSPDLLLRVPSRDIASYIGITEETLSRIRSRKILG
jgi:CRP-like cAMP-binding protein